MKTITTESAAADYTAGLAEYVRYEMNRAFKDVKETADVIVKRTERSFDLQDFAIESHLKAVCRRDIWARVAETDVDTFDTFKGTDDERLLAALDTVREFYKIEILSDHYHGRSTSQISNAARAIMQETVTTWLQSTCLRAGSK